MSLLAVLLLVLAPGIGFWLATGRHWRSRLDPAEAIYLVVIAGVALLSWPAILLAELGWFSLATLAVSSGLVAAGLLLWARRHGHLSALLPGQRLWPGHLALPPLLLLALWLAPEPFPYLAGGRDHGIYVNTGLWIAQSGGILIHDQELSALSPAARNLLTNPAVATGPALVPGPWSEGQRLAGLTIRDGQAGIVVPHAFHLYPVWIAIFAAAGSPTSGLWATPFLALLGGFGIYFAGTRLFGRPAALLALLLVILNVGQLWFQSYPTAEILVRALFWGGLWAGLMMLREGSSAAAALAALCLGLLHLTKLDTLFVPVIIIPLLLYARASGRWQRPYTIFLALYLLLSVHALLHAFGIATIYTLDQVTRVLLPDMMATWVATSINGARNPATIAARLLGAGWPLLLGAALVLSLLWLFVHRTGHVFRPALSLLERYAGWLFVLLLAPPVLLLAYAGLAYPLRPAPALTTLVGTTTLTSWYATALGLLLGLVGLLQASTGDLRADAPPTHRLLVPGWLLLLGNSLPLLFLGTGTYPDHFWAARRFVPVLFPALLLGAASVIAALATAGRRVMGWLLPLALTVALLAGELRSTAPVVHARDYAGLPEQLQALAAEFSSQDVLLFLPGDASNRVSLPLWLLHDRTVFQLAPEALAETTLSAQIGAWQERGRGVYLLYDGSSPPALGELAAEYRFSRQIAVPQMELATSALPRHTASYTAVFSVFSLRQASGSRQLPVATLQAQPGNDAAFASDGLYAVAMLPGLTPSSWTAGTATLALARAAASDTLILQLGNGRPGPVKPPVVEISLNGQPFTSITVSEAVELFEWPLPPFAAGEVITLTLVTEPWVPAETGHSADVRPLGVLFYQARVVGG